MGESARGQKPSQAQNAGELARNSPGERPRDPLADQLGIVSDSFLWLDNEAKDELETVRRELKEADAPTWSEVLIEGAIEIALTAIGARCGAVVAEKFMPKAAEHLPGEFVKKMFEEGVPAGVAESKGELKKGHKTDVDAFVDSYKRGLSKLHHDNQIRFRNQTQYQIRDLEEARQLADACSDANMRSLVGAQGDACRDAWVTYMAESKFGTMATQPMRDEVNARVPGWLPAEAPSLEAALIGSADGVLEIAAVVPEIRSNEMIGTPEVRVALLNGLNEATRDEYEGRPLSEMNIPRQITCSVKGDMPNFTLNINARGAQVGWLHHSQNEWLRARAMVGKPVGESHEDSSLAEAGLKLLLVDLVPESIRGKFV